MRSSEPFVATGKQLIAEVFADEQCTRHPRGKDSIFYVKLYQDIPLDTGYSSNAVVGQLENTSLMICGTNDLDEGATMCINCWVNCFSEERTADASHQFKAGEVIAVEAPFWVNPAGCYCRFYGDGSYDTPVETPVAEVFADANTFKLPYGTRDSVVVKVNRDFGYGDKMVWYNGNSEFLQISTPTQEYPDEPYVVYFDVDFMSEDLDSINAGDFIECNASFQMEIEDGTPLEFWADGTYSTPAGHYDLDS